MCVREREVERERERERENGRDRTLWRTQGPSARRTAVRQLAHTINGGVKPTERGRAKDPLPRRKASVEKDSRRTERLSHVRQHAVEGPDEAGDVR